MLRGQSGTPGARGRGHRVLAVHRPRVRTQVPLWRPGPGIHHRLPQPCRPRPRPARGPHPRPSRSPRHSHGRRRGGRAAQRARAVRRAPPEPVCHVPQPGAQPDGRWVQCMRCRMAGAWLPCAHPVLADTRTPGAACGQHEARLTRVRAALPRWRLQVATRLRTTSWPSPRPTSCWSCTTASSSSTASSNSGAGSGSSGRGSGGRGAGRSRHSARPWAPTRQPPRRRWGACGRIAARVQWCGKGEGDMLQFTHATH